MTEHITIRCSCGEVIIDEERDLFMMGLKSENDMEDFKKELNIMCNTCNEKIGYDNLDYKSKKDFKSCVSFLHRRDL